MKFSIFSSKSPNFRPRAKWARGLEGFPSFGSQFCGFERFWRNLVEFQENTEISPKSAKFRTFPENWHIRWISPEMAQESLNSFDAE